MDPNVAMGFPQNRYRSHSRERACLRECESQLDYSRALCVDEAVELCGSTTGVFARAPTHLRKESLLKHVAE